MGKQRTYTPSCFLAMFCSRKRFSSSETSRGEFVQIGKAKPDMSFATESFVIHLLLSPLTRVAADQENQVTLILHGEVYNNTEDDQAQFLKKQYLKRGESFSKDINGSFAILVIDKRNDVILLITDRVNSRKVFSSNYKGNYWLSTSLNLHPTTDIDLDIVGVASYLANGVINNDRTLFDGVRILERANIHKLTEGGFCSTRYWTYEFNNLYSAVDEKKLCAELSDLIIESVRIRLKRQSKGVFVSLSGGYDATGILGVLGDSLNIPDVECFSYIHGKPKKNSDAYVSQKLAEYFGFNHKMVESYKGNCLEALKDNAKLCQGCAQFCDEIDAWKELADDFSVVTPSVMFAGDECFGWTDRDLFTDKDILATVGIWDFDVLSWLSDRIPRSTYEKLRDGLNEDTLQILKRCPSTKDSQESKDFLYLDQRLNHRLLMWRESFAGQFVQVRNPFLDNAILDFMKKIPTPLRRGKKLYKKTIVGMFPDLFKIKRARTAGFVPDWRREFLSQCSAIEQLISRSESQIDEIIPPELITQLLRENKSIRNKEFSPARLMGGAIRRLSRKSHILHKAMLPLSRISAKTIHHTTLLKRILVLRLFLGKSKGISITNPTN